MSGYLLDTNVPSELMRDAPDKHVATWTANHDDLYTSVICAGEINHGIHLLPISRRRRRLEEQRERVFRSIFDGNVLPVTQAIAERWGAIAALRSDLGRPLNAPDGLIAATALEHGLTLVTRDVKDFAGLGLIVVNPWETL